MEEKDYASGFMKLSTRVELSISAQNLADHDVLSKSDPVCILYGKLATSSYNEISRTEVVKNSLNPKWVKKFEMDYNFEERQLLRFSVFDWDTKSTFSIEQDPLGTVECSLAEIMSHQGSELKKSLNSGGSLLIRGEEVSYSREVAVLKCSAKNLDKKDLFGKSDPFLIISRTSESKDATLVHRTEVIKKNLDPSWKPFDISIGTLCANDDDRKIKIECFDWDKVGTHDLIGEAYMTLKSLKENPFINLNLINPEKVKKSSYKESGILTVNLVSTYTRSSFLDYIKGGCQLHFTLAVDFTASNGNPAEPHSLHYFCPPADNQYTLAIKAVGEIIEDYDSDKMFPALGFGARVPPNWELKHDFYLNGQESPYCQGVAGILQAYQQAASSVKLYGPTNFSPVIRHVMNFASQYIDGRNYFVLLIITDGIITDVEETKKALVEASALPMSVIIVGVGAEPISVMQLLDGDNERLEYKGRYAERDIVQVVEMSKYGCDLSNTQISHAAIKRDLARDVLAEIPEQLVGWMKSHNILPITQG